MNRTRDVLDSKPWNPDSNAVELTDTIAAYPLPLALSPHEITNKEDIVSNVSRQLNAATILAEKDNHLDAATLKLETARYLAANNLFADAVSLQLQTASDLVRTGYHTAAKDVARAAADAIETSQEPHDLNPFCRQRREVQDASERQCHCPSAPRRKIGHKVTAQYEESAKRIRSTSVRPILWGVSLSL